MLHYLYLMTLGPNDSAENEDIVAKVNSVAQKAVLLNSIQGIDLFDRTNVKLPKNPWDDFYSTHRERFFKDRHYLDQEHATLASALAVPGSTVRILDFGCGVGNAIVPLLEKAQAKVQYLGLDISPTAITLLQEKLNLSAKRHSYMLWPLDLAHCSGAEWNDKIKEFNIFTNQAEDAFFDFCLMIFTVSAIHPREMRNAISRACRTLKPGLGRICFRDYLEGDLAQKRFASGQKLGRNLYIRQDGTLSFFFSEAGLLSLVAEIGDMNALWVKKIKRVVENRSVDLQMDRAWIGAEFIRM